MSDRFQSSYLSGKTCYFLVRDSAGLIWNGSSFVAYVTANYATYPLTATEQGTSSGYYTAVIPALAAGVYSVLLKDRQGGSPAESDFDAGAGTIEWGGTALASVVTLVNDLLVADADTYAASAAKQSLVNAILKLSSRFVATTGKTYRKDGVTVQMTQTPVTSGSMVPIQELGVGA